MKGTELAWVADIPEAGSGYLRRTLDEVEIGLFRVGDRVVAWRNVCPHEAAPVCRGIVTGTRLESRVGEYQFGRAGEILRCPWHGWEFDLVNGEHLAAGSGARLRSYPISVQNGIVYDAAGLAHERVLRVRGREQVADQVVQLDLEPTDAAPLPSWAPGAHLEVRLRSGLTRHYSLCGDPRDPATFRIAVLKENEGRGGSAEVHDTAVPGTELYMVGLRNRFPLRPASSYLFLAGGIGITGVLSAAQAATRRRVPSEFVYIGRNPQAMAYRDAAAHLPNSSTIYTEHHGRPDLATLIADTSPGTTIYCCGPAGMIAEAMAVGERAGRTVQVERYSAQSPEPFDDKPAQSFDVRLARSGRTISVGADETLLQAIRKAGVEVPSSCEAGWCGSCETTVLAGTPHHRDSVLTDEEREDSTTMMVCVGRSAGGRLTVDR